MNERRALGKGLSSLIPLGRDSGSGKNYFDCSLTDLIASPNQPRKLFDKNAIDELAASIEEKGIIQPLVVRPLGGGKYEIIAGERRFRAAQSLNLEKVPVIVKEVDDQEMLELALIENLQRQDLNPVEEALAFKELLSKYQYTQDELAQRIGKDRSSIANTLRLLKLPETVRGKIISGQLSMGHARALLAIEDADIQKKVSDKIIENQLSVRDIEDLVRRMKDGEAPEEMIEAQAEEQAVAEQASKDGDLALAHLQDELKKSLKTKVQLKGSAVKGKMVIHYHSSEELNNLFEFLTRRNA